MLDISCRKIVAFIAQHMNVLTESVPGLNVQSLPTAYFALVEVCPVLHMMMRKSVVCTR